MPATQMIAVLPVKPGAGPRIDLREMESLEGMTFSDAVAYFEALKAAAEVSGAIEAKAYSVQDFCNLLNEEVFKPEKHWIGNFFVETINY